MKYPIIGRAFGIFVSASPYQERGGMGIAGRPSCYTWDGSQIARICKRRYAHNTRTDPLEQCVVG